jgi:L-aspartate oxidase
MVGYHRVHSVDFLVVGGGVAGLRAAIGLAAAGRVLVLTKAAPAESNTGYAQGGIAAAFGADDTPALHASDTLRAGDGLCDEAAVTSLVQDGPRYVRELLEWGARFDRDADGRPALAREAAHSVRRVLHAGDATGREIGRVLWERVRMLPTVETIDHALVTELIVESGHATGLHYFDADGVRRTVHAAATLLATGGAGQVFRETTNPSVATGDGVALAYHAGARVADLEFVQFHPTALSLAGAPRFLISEALRGEGARLVNAEGERFMGRHHPDGDLAPRDVVARGIVRESERTGAPVYLTLQHLDADFVRARFPTIAAMCAQAGLDLARDRIPVGPAAHYIMGGVDTDEWAHTSVPRLFAAGEVACTGVHGANRLASNSLLEGLVFGARAAKAMTEPPVAALLKSDRVSARGLALTATDSSARSPLDAPESLPGEGAGATTRLAEAPEAPKGQPSALSSEAIRDLMWQQAGLFRNRERLGDAVRALDSARVERAPQTAEEWRHWNLLTVGRLIARAALRREESRGGHYREDFPQRDDERWKIHLVDQGHEGQQRTQREIR